MDSELYTPKKSKFDDMVKQNPHIGLIMLGISWCVCSCIWLYWFDYTWITHPYLWVVNWLNQLFPHSFWESELSIMADWYQLVDLFLEINILFGACCILTGISFYVHTSLYHLVRKISSILVGVFFCCYMYAYYNIVWIPRIVSMHVVFQIVTVIYLFFAAILCILLVMGTVVILWVGFDELETKNAGVVHKQKDLLAPETQDRSDKITEIKEESTDAI